MVDGQTASEVTATRTITNDFPGNTMRAKRLLVMLFVAAAVVPSHGLAAKKEKEDTPERAAFETIRWMAGKWRKSYGNDNRRCRPFATNFTPA